MLKALIFDLDGTLIDSLADLAESVNRMLDQQGHPRQPLEVFPQFIGEGVRQLVQRALPTDQQQPDYIDHCVDLYKAHYAQLWHDQTRPYPHILSTLTALKERGTHLACISNKTHHFTTLCCQHFFPHTFEVILGQRSGIPAKPAPDAAKECAGTLQLALTDCAYIGDSGIDMQFAKNSGMTAIGVSWGFRSREELLSHGADQIIHQATDLLHLTTA
jgi:phosphoglycolate phosphatase